MAYDVPTGTNCPECGGREFYQVNPAVTNVGGEVGVPEERRGPSCWRSGCSRYESQGL